MGTIENMTILKNFFKKITIPKLFDFILTNIALFFIIFAWARFVFKNSIFVVLILSFTFCFMWNVLFFVVKCIKKQPNLSTKEVDKWAQFVLTQSEKDNLKFLIGLYQENSCSPKNEQNDVLFDKKDKEKNIKLKIISSNLFVLPNKKTIAFDYFEEKLSLVRALKIIRIALNNKITKLAIFCVEYDKKDRLFLENLKDIEVAICDKNCLAIKTKKIGLEVPNILQEKSHNKIKFKELLSLSISKEKAKKYFLSGILIFFCSLIVRQNIYYVLMSSLLFFLAILSIRQKENPIKQGFWE